MADLNTATLPELPAFPLPPTPPVSNEDLARQAVTHSSFTAGLKNSTSLELRGAAPTGDYEKLEHVGDALINGMVTTLLNDLYPDLPPGSATTLAQLSLRSGLIDRFIAAPSAFYTARMQTKVQASVFEAYAAAVYYDYLTSECPGAYDDHESVAAVADAESVRGSIDEEMEVNDMTERPNVSKTEYNSPLEKDPETPWRGFPNPHSRAASASPAIIESAYRAVPPIAPLPTLPPLSERTRGQAFTYLERWLRPLLTPVAAFALGFMRQCEKDVQGTGEDDDMADPNPENDAMVVGATGALNSWLQKTQGTMPVYTSEAVGGRWRGICTVKYRDQTFKGEAVRDTKKAAHAVAAWKVCKLAGLRV